MPGKDNTPFTSIPLIQAWGLGTPVNYSMERAVNLLVTSKDRSSQNLVSRIDPGLCYSRQSFYSAPQYFA